MKTSLEPIFDQQTKILIVGSTPGEISLAKKQYYANNGNQFWKIIFAYFNTAFSMNYETRLNLLLTNHIGLWDVYSTFNRIGSLDSAIKENNISDFQSVTNHTKLELVIANGKTAYNEILYHQLFNDVKVIGCISTSGAANGFMLERKKQWYHALDSVFS